MNVLYKGARLIKDMYNQLNPATLTGAIDILVIEQENKELTASPFHVRFGKLGVLRAKEKVVNITINEEIVDLHMKLGDQGEAFFVVETDDEEIPARLLTSPLPSRPVSPSVDDISERFASNEEPIVKRKRRKRRKRRSLSTSEMSNEHSQSSDSEDDISNTNQSQHNTNSGLPSIEQSPLSKRNHPCEPQLNLDIQDDFTIPTFRLTMCYDSGTDSTSISLFSDTDSDSENTATYKRLCSVFSDSELPQSGDENDIELSNTPYSDSEAVERNQTSTPVGWDWGQLPEDSAGKRRHLTVPSMSKLSIENENNRHSKIRHLAKSDSVFHESETKISEVPIKTNQEENSSDTNQPLSSREGSPKKKSDRTRPATEGLYLDEILDLEPNEANLYLSTKNQPKSQDFQEMNSESLIDNVRSRTPDGRFTCSDAGVDSGTDCLVSDDPGECADLSVSPIKISLCGGKFEDGKLSVDLEKFNEKLVTYDQFLLDPVGITSNAELVVMLGDRYLDWETAAPFFLSFCVFKKPLSNEIVESVIDKQISKRVQASSAGRLSWLWRRSSQRTDSISSNVSDQGLSPIKDKELNQDVATNAPNKVTLMKSFSASPNVPEIKNRTDESSSCEDEISTITRKDLKRAQTMQNIFPQHLSPTKSMKKTTRLTPDQLKSLNLKPGANEVSFSVTSQYQGTSRCYATIYLWKYTDRLVVSDIDGTITKSDVFGQILPVVGKDWTQGGVAQLYHNISKNGYKFIYLSARAIGQAGMTKGYLNWINQQGVCLPEGPLFLSPTSLMRAFRTEVIEKKPEKFKIQCLEDIKALFPINKQPLAAGFGNKINDVVAYTAVGIPNKRVFTINHRGELKQEDLQTYTTSYSELGDIVDTFFPALDSPECTDFSDTHEFSTFNYWRDNMCDISSDINI
ncbi:phosphatidate phosphatase LPIN1-like isoform X1 [Styela clava]